MLLAALPYLKAALQRTSSFPLQAHPLMDYPSMEPHDSHAAGATQHLCARHHVLD